MAFVNEYISQEDIQKYSLNELWVSYSGNYDRLPDEQEWVIDRDRECWLMDTARVRDYNTDHQNTSEYIWTLHCKGTNIEVRIEYVPEPKKPGYFNIVWKLLSLSPSSLDTLSNKEMIKILEEALQVYGYMGIHNQKPNTTVELRVK